MTNLSEKRQSDDLKFQITTQEPLVAANFSKQALAYEQYAKVQKFVAKHLHYKIIDYVDSATPGRILEIGCGTGLLSRHLAAHFKNSKIDFLDPSHMMLEQCEKNTNNSLSTGASSLNYNYIEKSIEDYLADTALSTNKYTLIASSFALHWLADLPSVMNKLVDRLEIGGHIFFAYPTDKSFPEWKAVCKTLDLPFTGNKFPPANLFTMLDSKKANLSFKEYSFKFTLPNSFQFFKEIKNIGAQTLIQSDELNKNKRPLSVSEFRHLLRTWNKTFSQNVNSNASRGAPDGPVDCTYWLVEGIITRHS